MVHLQKKLKSSKIEKNKNFHTDLDSTQKVMYITPKQVFEKVDFSLSETPEKPFPRQILTSLYNGLLLCTANIFCGKSGIRIVFRKAFLPLQALKSYLQPPVFPGESQSVNQVLA